MNIKWILSVVVAVVAFSALAGSASAGSNHHHNNDPKCYETIQVEKEVKDYYVPGHFEGNWPHIHWVDGYWVYKTILVDEKVEVPCNTPCDDGQAGEFVETTGCQDPCGDGLVGDFEPNCEEPTCENGGIDPQSDECHEFFDICFDGQIINVRDDDQREDTGDCDPASLCVDGDFVGGTEFEIGQLSGTNDCGPVRLCVDGESMTVTKFDAEQLDGEKGSCVPTENPPPPTVTEEEPEEPVEEVQEAVLDQSPVIEEVAALPAAGYGTAGDTGISWTLVLGLVLIGVGGGATVLIARRS
jgi:hypothetical protein